MDYMRESARGPLATKRYLPRRASTKPGRNWRLDCSVLRSQKTRTRGSNPGRRRILRVIEGRQGQGADTALTERSGVDDLASHLMWSGSVDTISDFNPTLLRCRP